MKCPNCNETLVMTERSNVEIDYCPQCRGVWLDKGELDKIIEQSQSHRYNSDSTGYSERENKRHEEEYKDRNHPKKKRGGFLGDLFDFD